MTSPAGLSKLTVGLATAVNVQSFGLVSSQPVLLLNAGGGALASATQGNWSADALQSHAAAQSVTNTTLPSNTTLAPTSVFQSR